MAQGLRQRPQAANLAPKLLNFGGLNFAILILLSVHWMCQKKSEPWREEHSHEGVYLVCSGSVVVLKTIHMNARTQVLIVKR